MSHRALVAIQQKDGTYNIHRSQNGADEMQLLSELRDSLNVHGRVDWEALTGEAIPSILTQVQSKEMVGDQKIEVADPDLIDPQPIVAGLQRDEILMQGDLLKYEVLYTVENETVTAYQLAWTFPDVVQKLVDHYTVEVYRSGAIQRGVKRLHKTINEDEPIAVIDTLEDDWLSDSLRRQVVEDEHRWIFELSRIAAGTREKNGIDADEEFTQAIATEEHILAITEAPAECPTAGHVPFIYPVKLPGSEGAASARLNELQENIASIRFRIGAGLHALHERSEEEQYKSMADAAFEFLEEYSADVDQTLLPDEMAEMVREFRNVQSMDKMSEKWDELPF